MQTESDIELQQFVSDQLDGGTRSALRDRSPDFQVRTYSLSDGAQKTVIYHDGIKDLHPGVELAALEKISGDELPVRLVNGKEKPVRRGNYIRKQGKEIKQAKHTAIADHIIAFVKDAGYVDAEVKVRGSKLVIALDGFPAGEGI